MAGPVACPASRRSLYSGRHTSRLRLPALLAVFGLGLTCGGCAVSGQMGSLFGGPTDDSKLFAKAEATGSIAAAMSNGKTSSGLPPEADLAYARAAVADVLERGGKTASASWENPRTGARGTVTPIASPYTQDGVTCHDFLASYLRGGAESWLQGEACRVQRGQWEVRTIRPWKRS
jgi:surface antigen